MNYNTSLKPIVSVFILFFLQKNTNFKFLSDRIFFMNGGTFIISIIVSVFRLHDLFTDLNYSPKALSVNYRIKFTILITKALYIILIF